LSQTFSDFNLDSRIVEALASLGILEPFPIQSLTLPIALGGNDIIGQAKTGTGKTLGFGLPLIQNVLNVEHKTKLPKALVVVPTRELATQVANDLSVAASKTDLKVSVFYGGKAYEPQVADLEAGVDIVVGTPGRLIDLMNQKILKLNEVRMLVLDEADEMLDMGFLPDVERLLKNLPSSKQMMLFSATMPGQIISLARSHMNNPTHLNATDPNDESSVVDAIEQHVWRAHPMDKTELIGRILQAEGRNLVIIFCKTKRNAQKVYEDLLERGFKAGAIHGDMGQGARESALKQLRAGKVDVLVATDVAARGLDIDGITHVINFECPEDDKTYVHRIGRTGRAGADGVAVTLVDWADLSRWQMINKTLGLPFSDPLETYSNSPHVFTGLNIPEGTKGRLVAAKAAPVTEKREPREKRDSRPRDSKPRDSKPREPKAKSDQPVQRKRIRVERKED
jgi:superfamily II DNA/RNA helicase